MDNSRLVLPAHLNQYGFLFGGHLLKWVDEIAWMAATLEFPDCLFVTVAMNDVSFHRSVREGSILQFETNCAKVGDTSVTYSVNVYRDKEEMFSTEVTLVRVDESGRKLSLPKN